MPINPYTKGGTDVAVVDGGTDASVAATALSNLGGLSAATHALIDHTGLTGVGDLTTAAHASLDHSMVPMSFRNIGTATAAVASGDLAAGDASNTLFWDASVGTIALSGSGSLGLAATSATLTLEATGSNRISLRTNSTERLRVEDSGNVQIGENIGGFTMDAANLMIANNGGQVTMRVRLANATPGNGAAVTLQRSKGSLTAPTAVTTNDLIAQWVAQGYIGASTQHSVMGRVEFYSDGVPVDTSSAPGRISLQTTPSGSLVPVERIRINNIGTSFMGDGTLSINAAGAASVPLIAYRSGSDAQLVVDAYTATADQSPLVQLRRARGTAAAPAIVAQNDYIGRIVFQGATTAAAFSTFADIRGEVDGATVGATDAPGRIVFSTTTDGTSTLTERARLTNASTWFFGDGTLASAALFGGVGNAVIPVYLYRNSSAQIFAAGFSATATDSGVLQLLKGRGTAATPAAVANGDRLGGVFAGGVYTSPSTGYNNGAAIIFHAEDAFTGADSPGRISFFTTPDGSNALVERARINNIGTLFSGDGTLSTTFNGGGAASIAILAYRTASDCVVTADAYSATATESAVWTLRRGRGTAATPAAVVNNDRIGRVLFQGTVSATANETFAQILCEVDGTTVGVGDSPGRLVFYTTPDGSGTTIARWQINNAGHLLASTDNVVDIGAAGATRPRDLHLGRYLLAGGEYQPIILSKTSVNLAAVGTTNIYTVPTGLSLVVTEAIVRPTTATAANGDAVAGIGVAAGEDDIFASQTLTGLNTTTERFKFISSGVAYVAQSTEVVKFGVDTADTGTALVADVYLIGYLI